MTRLAAALPVLATLVAGMLLEAFRLPPEWPDWLRWGRPDWVLAAVFLWAVAQPPRIGLLLAWTVGLLLDALLSEPLGMRAFAFATVVWVVGRLEDKLGMFSPLQQCGVLFLSVACFELYLGAVRFAVLGIPPSPFLPVPALATTIVYMPITVLMRRWTTVKRFDHVR